MTRRRRLGPRGGVAIREASQVDVGRQVRSIGVIAALAITVVVLAGACSPATSPGPSASATAPPATGSPAAGSPSASPSPSGPPATAVTGPVRLALDWTPNTDHTGIYVAQANGWYAAAGVDLRILPYADTAPEALIGAGQAECGISFQDALTFAAAAGTPIVSVMAILQKTASVVSVLADGPITRPRELDGKTFAGFGYPADGPTLKAIIRADGGRGEFTTVTLDSAAYEALYAKRADFTIVFTAWEGIQAQRRGIALRDFVYSDYGFPESYQVVLACDSRWLAREPDLARAFVDATVRGYEEAASDPETAAGILVQQNPGVFDADPGLPLASQEFLDQGGYLVDPAGHVGTQTLAQWQGYSGFLYDQGILTDQDGKPLASPPDYASLFTDDLLPAP